jgi:hypothetical protein
MATEKPLPLAARHHHQLRTRPRTGLFLARHSRSRPALCRYGGPPEAVPPIVYTAGICHGYNFGSDTSLSSTQCEERDPSLRGDASLALTMTARELFVVILSLAFSCPSPERRGVRDEVPSLRQPSFKGPPPAVSLSASEGSPRSDGFGFSAFAEAWAVIYGTRNLAGGFAARFAPSKSRPF